MRGRHLQGRSPGIPDHSSGMARLLRAPPLLSRRQSRISCLPRWQWNYRSGFRLKSPIWCGFKRTFSVLVHPRDRELRTLRLVHSPYVTRHLAPCERVKSPAAAGCASGRSSLRILPSRIGQGRGHQRLATNPEGLVPSLSARDRSTESASSGRTTFYFPLNRAFRRGSKDALVSVDNARLRLHQRDQVTAPVLPSGTHQGRSPLPRVQRRRNSQEHGTVDWPVESRLQQGQQATNRVRELRSAPWTERVAGRQPPRGDRTFRPELGLGEPLLRGPRHALDGGLRLPPSGIARIDWRRCHELSLRHVGRQVERYDVCSWSCHLRALMISPFPFSLDPVAPGCLFDVFPGALRGPGSTWRYRP